MRTLEDLLGLIKRLWQPPNQEYKNFAALAEDIMVNKIQGTYKQPYNYIVSDKSIDNVWFIVGITDYDNNYVGSVKFSGQNIDGEMVFNQAVQVGVDFLGENLWKELPY